MRCIICLQAQSSLTKRSFHRIPQKTDTRNLWVNIILRSVNTQVDPLKVYYVCSDHFQNSDFVQKRGRRLLMEGVVPTVNLQPTSTLDEVYDEDESKQGQTSSLVDHFLRRENLDKMEKNAETTVPTPLASPRPLRVVRVFNAHDVKNDQRDLSFYTGLKNILIFDALFELFFPTIIKLPLIKTTETTRIPNPESPRQKSGRKRILCGEDQFLLTLIRLRHNVVEQILGDMFGVSTSTVSRTVNSWLIVMSELLQQMPIWLSRERVRERLPPIFLKFRNVRVILDCTEIEVERATSSYAQKETFSNYKQRNTCKGLIGVSPDGQVTFVSNLYGGSSKNTDKKITEHSKILDLLEPGDGILADRGFPITNICEKRNIEVILPEFTSGQEQFTREQVQRSRDVAIAREMVERRIRTIKQFKILHSKIPLSLSPMLDHIWVVCCYLANYSHSVPCDESV